jgi:hypothetical protein
MAGRSEARPGRGSVFPKASATGIWWNGKSGRSNSTPRGRGSIPVDFSRRGLADKKGRTVANEAARAWRLPVGFDRLDLVDKRGVTVAKAAAGADRQRDNSGDSPGDSPGRDKKP